MDIDLKQGLGEIADDAPTAHLDTDALWRSGVRRRTRRRVGTVAAVLASVALLTGGVLTVDGVTRTDEPPVADDSSVGALPDRVWMPSPWTQGTDRAGDPGRIAVMFWDNGQRRSLGGPEGGGWVTVSALDGSYRYLDARGLDEPGDVEPLLSPDGRYVAYPKQMKGSYETTSQITVGWGVYDAQTGEVKEHIADEAPQGVVPTSMAWSPDSSTLLLDACHVTLVRKDGQSCTIRTHHAWNVREGSSRIFDGALVSDVAGHAGDDLVVRQGRRLGAFDLRTGDITPLGRLPVAPDTGDDLVQVDRATGTAVVAEPVIDEDTGSAVAVDLRVQDLAPDASPATPRRLVAARWLDPVDVLPDGRVLVMLAEEDSTAFVLAGRPEASQVRELVRFGRFGGALPQVATDLAELPTTSGVRPPAVRDPRVGIAGIVLVVGFAAGVGLVAWRRRRGPLGIAR